VPRDDFFDDQWEEPSRTHETAPVGRPDEPQAPQEPPAEPTGEPAPGRPPRPRRGGGGGGGGGFTRPQALENLEIGRLAVLAAGILVVILVLVLLARSCGGSSAESKNEDYLNQVKSALKKSDQAGVALNAILRAPRPLKAKAAVKQAKTAHDLMQQALSSASAIKPTTQAEAANPSLIQALSYRVNGLQCLQQNLPQAYSASRNAAGGARLAPCMQRLLASDVVYADSYQAQLNNDLSDASVDARAPGSVILPPASVNTVTAAGSGLMLQRLKPGSQASGLHGLSLDSTVAQSAGKSVTLRGGGEVNQVRASTDLTFVVTATNGGDFQEFDIPVKVTLGEGKDAITRSAKIDQIGPKQKATVSVKGITSDSSNLDFGQDVKLTVLVTPVPGERTTSNNKAVYTLAFTLGQ
jgi:hypothetical protein